MGTAATWSCDQLPVNEIPFLCTKNALVQDLVKIALWFLRKTNFDFHINDLA